jgi:sialate O-acetylesterase
VDNTWLNGAAVGYTSGAGTDREYEIAPRVLRASDNVLVINALDTYGNGGIYGPADKRVLHLGDGGRVALDGPWHYQVAPTIPGRAPRAPWEPVRGLTVIHNAMIAPLVPYGVKGVLWYQGESNTDDTDRYQRLLAGLMADWRSKFGAELPFLVVQLANYGPVATQPAESGWAGVRDAQRAAVAEDAHAGLTVTIDIGDPYDIHPANKQEVGRRLVRAARHVVYGESLAPSGPVARSAHVEDGRVVVEFEDVEGQLLAHGADIVIGFELCGAEAETCRYVTGTPDRNRVWLDPGATTAARVRYGWADSPVCTLFDLAGLPAGPFELPITSP